MFQLSRRTGRLVFAAAALALVAGCGGGGGGDDGGPSRAPMEASQVPASALQGADGLAAFMRTLNQNGTDSTSSPLLLGDAVLPTSDTAQPVAVN